MSIYFKNKLKLCTLSTGKRESLMHSYVCSCGELVSQRGNVSDSAGCSWYLSTLKLISFCRIYNNSRLLGVHFQKLFILACHCVNHFYGCMSILSAFRKCWKMFSAFSIQRKGDISQICSV